MNPAWPLFLSVFFTELGVGHIKMAGRKAEGNGARRRRVRVQVRSPRPGGLLRYFARDKAPAVELFLCVPGFRWVYTPLNPPVARSR